MKGLYEYVYYLLHKAIEWSVEKYYGSEQVGVIIPKYLSPSMYIDQCVYQIRCYCSPTIVHMRNIHSKDVLVIFYKYSDEKTYSLIKNGEDTLWDAYHRQTKGEDVSVIICLYDDIDNLFQEMEREVFEYIYINYPYYHQYFRLKDFETFQN